MKLLVIGGGVFLGRAVVTAALTQGHAVTVFNRGRVSANDETQVTWLRGDRDGDLTALRTGEWDAVIDTCGYLPRQVRTLLAALRGRIGHYTFVSTVAAYADMSRPGLKETDALIVAAGDEVEKGTPGSYGPLKAGCEAAALAEDGVKTLIVRPGIIVGPHDSTDRFSYWAARGASGGEMLAPGEPDAPFQVIDVRDLATWMVAAAERGLAGIFNAVGPGEPLTFGEALAVCVREAGRDTWLVWVCDDWLAARSLADWSKLPLYLSRTATSTAGFYTINGSKAFEAGLEVRPLRETVADTQAWLANEKSAAPLKMGLTRQAEKEFLKAWADEA